MACRGRKTRSAQLQEHGRRAAGGQKKEIIDLFSKYKVYSEKELASRFIILCEGYTKTVVIEGNLAALIAKTQILPAALRYQTQVAAAVNGGKAAGIDVATQFEELKSCSAKRFLRCSRASASSKRRCTIIPREMLTPMPRAPATRFCRQWPTCARRPTSWKPWSPTISGRCRRTGKCSSLSEDDRRV
jgi:hypothetical protein